MSIDQTTLLLVLTASSLVLAACLIAVDPWAQRDDGLKAWGAGLLVHAASNVAYLLRWWDWMTVSVLLSNGLSSLTLALHLHALTRFAPDLSRRWRVLIVWGPPVLTQVVALVALHAHDLRIVVCSGLLALQAGAAVGLAARAARGGALRGAWLVVAGMGLLGVTMLARVVMVAVHGGWTPPAGPPAAVQVTTHLVSLVVVLLNTTGYLLMQKERVVQLLHELATHDPLTGATNRRAMRDVLHRNVALSARTHLPLSLLMIDIDHFKRVNDEHGHPVGDVVLREVAARVQARLRGQDLLARYGGEEFLVVLPLTAPEGARCVAEDIRAAVARTPVTVGREALPVSVSVGVATRAHWPGEPHGATTPAAHPGLLLAAGEVEGLAQQLLEACDAAMYEAKRQGRDRVVARGVGDAATAVPASAWSGAGPGSGTGIDRELRHAVDV